MISPPACESRSGADSPGLLTTHHKYEANWLVSSVPEAVAVMVSSGGQVIVEECLIPVRRLAVVADPFGNPLTLLDLSAGTYVTDRDRHVVGVDSPDTEGRRDTARFWLAGPRRPSNRHLGCFARGWFFGADCC